MVDANTALEEWVSALVPHAASDRWMSLNLITLARQRFVAGAAEYGSEWRDRDNVEELKQELADAFNYTLMAAATGQIGPATAEVVSANLSVIWGLIGDCRREQ